jgi:glycerol-3-phosphate acyltransferase PlsX
MKIAVDAMGGDFGPEVTVAGAVSASREFQLEVLLVGAEAVIQEEFDRIDHSHATISIVDAAESIGMSEGILSFRRKKRSSILVGTQLVKNKEADAFVSTGNTGAVVYISKKVLGALEGVDRPALSLLVPTLNGLTLLTDVGANVNCSAQHLEQFAHMGRIFMQSVMGIADPRIALMSIGEESTKGNDVTREAYEILSKSSLNFIGNIEGRDIYSGKADVIVSDGFTGNVALKASEGMVDTLEKIARTEIMRNLFAKVGYLLLRRHLKRIYRRVDYSEYGGAHLLGINGVCIIGHGRSNPVAIKNAVRLARDYVTGQVQAKIEKEMAGFRRALNGARA